MRNLKRPVIIVVGLIGVAGIILLLAISLPRPKPQAGDKVELRMAPLSDLPADLRAAPPEVREAYRFALANPDLLQQFPCYCGCVNSGHTSNYACYVSGTNPDGSVALEYHAAY